MFKILILNWIMADLKKERREIEFNRRKLEARKRCVFWFSGYH
jgi:hypothetical protein